MAAWSRSEFEFELLVCRWAELAWSVDRDRGVPVIVGRQIGTRSRRWDTIVVECDPDGLARRAAFGEGELDRDLLFVLDHAPPTWEWYRDALPDPGYPWRYVREHVHRAADRELLRTRRNGNRIEIRQMAAYPDWVDRIVAIENKPDLEASAAAALSGQLAHDVDSGLIDETWVATAATDDRVPPALLEEMPVEAGILSMTFEAGVDPGSGQVLWNPVGAARSTGDGSGGDRSPGNDENRLRRYEIAERAYGRGWRSYHRTMRPDCRWFELRHDGFGFVPWCEAKDRSQTPRECAGDCEEFQPEPPQWRTNGPPIEGGPGQGILRLLERRRDRHRERVRDASETIDR